MATIDVLTAKGLQTSSNESGASVAGGMSTAHNVVIRSKDVVEPRRGQQYWCQDFVQSAVSNYTRGIPFCDRLFVLGATAGFPQAYFPQNASTGTPVSMAPVLSRSMAAPAPTVQRWRSSEQQGSLFLTSASGPKLVEPNFASSFGTAPTLRDAGLPPGSAPEADTAGATSSGTVLAAGLSMAYVVVWGYKDAGGTVVYGAPSGRCVYTNSTAGTVNPALKIPIPLGLPSTAFCRVFRSDATIAAGGTPSDEMYLVYVKTPSSSEKTAGFFSLVDIATSGSSVPLYTSPSQGGVLQANNQPPLCNDVASWGGAMWYANTTSRQRLQIQFIAAPTSGDTYIFNGQAYTFYENTTTTPVLCGQGIWVSNTNGITSVAKKIELAVTGLVNAINRRNYLGADRTTEAANKAVTGNLVDYGYARFRASYDSGATDNPGLMTIESTQFPTEAISFSVNGTLGITSPAPATARTATVSRSSATTVLATPGSAIDSTPTSVQLAVKETLNTGVPTGNYNGGSASFGRGVFPATGTTTSVTVTDGYNGGSGSTDAGNTWFIANALSQSVADVCPNRIHFSKYQMPEAVPYTYYLDVGSKNKAILRISALRDRLFVFKEDGIFTVSGSYPFSVDLLDDTARLLSAESVAKVGNMVYGFTNQGVVAVSDAGVMIVSKPIEQELNQFIDRSNYQTDFSYGYEAERLYVLNLGVPGAAVGTSKTYCLNVLYGTWTTRDFGMLSVYDAAVAPTTDTLFAFGNAYGLSSSVTKERKTFSRSDYADKSSNYIQQGTPGSVVDLTTAAVPTVRLTIHTGSGTGQQGVGDLVSFTGTDAAVKYGTLSNVVSQVTGTAVYDIATNGLWDASKVPVSVGTAYAMYSAFTCTVQWLPQVCGASDFTKQFSKVGFHFGRRYFTDPAVTFSTDMSANGTALPGSSTTLNMPLALRSIADISSGGSGISTYTHCIPSVREVYVGTEQARGQYLVLGFQVQEAWSTWALYGYSLTFDVTSDLVHN